MGATTTTGSRLARLAGPIPLATLGATGLTVWITGLWWILPLGLAAAGLSAAHAWFGAPSAPPAAEEPASLAPVLALRDAIEAELDAAGEDALVDRAEVRARVAEVVEAYRGLLDRRAELAPHLDARKDAVLARSIDDLARKRDRTADPVARRNLESALKNLEEQRQLREELARSGERVESQLLSLASALESLKVRVVKGRLARDEAMDPADEVRAGLEGVFHEVELAERTNRELARLIGARSAQGA